MSLKVHGREITFYQRQQRIDFDIGMINFIVPPVLVKIAWLQLHPITSDKYLLTAIHSRDPPFREAL